jgi:transcriptional regulator with XRE-family HTH domain
MNDIFVERLSQIMKTRGINQKDLSALTGISKSAISQYLSGKFFPKTKYIEIIAEALDVDEEWLIGNSEEMASFGNNKHRYTYSIPYANFENNYSEKISSTIDFFQQKQVQKLYVQLVNNLSCFNEEGLEKISDYMNDLLQIDAYISKSSHSNE